MPNKVSSNCKTMLWDIESSNLNAPFATILCMGYKLLNAKKTNVVSIDDFPLFKKDPTNDKELLKVMSKILSEADLWVTHYGGGFDVPMVNTRLISHGLKPLPPIKNIDTWRIAKYKMRMHSNRLQAISEFLEVGNKTPIKPRTWLKAMAGDKTALKYIKAHAIMDVKVLEQVYLKIRPLTTTHPNVNLVDGGNRGACPICAAVDKLVRRGYNIARTARSIRFQCKACGGWSSKPDKGKSSIIR